VQGKDAIRKFLEGFPKMTEFKQTVEEIQGDQEYAYPRGTYQTTFTPPGSKRPVKDKGKVLAVWRKQSDGSWKVSRVIWNSDQAPQM
jgi:ketosteroid isomerase-like protein